MAISSAQVTTQGSTPATNKELGGVHQRKLPLAKGVGPNCHLQRYQASRQNRKLGVEFQHKSQSSKRPNRYCITLCRVIAAISFRFSSFLLLFFTATRLSALAIYQTLLNVTARTLCGIYIYIRHIHIELLSGVEMRLMPTSAAHFLSCCDRDLSNTCQIYVTLNF